MKNACYPTTNNTFQRNLPPTVGPWIRVAWRTKFSNELILYLSVSCFSLFFFFFPFFFFFFFLFFFLFSFFFFCVSRYVQVCVAALDFPRLSLKLISLSGVHTYVCVCVCVCARARVYMCVYVYARVCSSSASSRRYIACRKKHHSPTMRAIRLPLMISPF